MSLASDSGKPTPNEPQSLDAVQVFAPWSGPEERPLRLRIHRARDAALARAMRSKHSKARTAYYTAAEFASTWVFQRAPIDHLQEVIKGVTWLFLFAGMIERIEAPDDER